MAKKKKEDEQGNKDVNEGNPSVQDIDKEKKKEKKKHKDKDKGKDKDKDTEQDRRKSADKADNKEEDIDAEGKKKKKHKKKKDKDKDEGSTLKDDKGDTPKGQKSNTNVGPYQISDPEKRSDSLFEDDEDDKFVDAFSDSSIRAKFIRKVYIILTIQLGFTTCFNIPFLYLDDVQEFIYDYHWILFIALAVFVVPYFMLVCCESTRRNFPTNIILLFLMTLGMAGVCGYMTAKMDTEVVFYAFLLTVVVTLSITTLAIFCPFDFTKCLMVMCVVIIVLIVFAMVAVIIVIVTKSKVVNLVYAGICVFLFSLFLMFDTQAIIGGRRVRLNPEEYILAAIQIYVDIVEIFLNFLELIGACTEND